MTSLAVQLNYNNTTTNTAKAGGALTTSSSSTVNNNNNSNSISIEKHRITRNPNSSLNIINSNNNNSINNGSTNITLNNSNSAGGFGFNLNSSINTSNSANLQQFNSFSLASNNKMPSSNIIYNLKTANGIGGTIMESNSNTTASSASYALINRIKTFESQNNHINKKRSNSSFNNNLNSVNQKLNSSNNSIINNVTSNSTVNNNNTPSATNLLNNSHLNSQSSLNRPLTTASTNTHHSKSNNNNSINNISTNNFSLINFYNQSSNNNLNTSNDNLLNNFNHQISSNNFNDSNGMLIVPSSPTFDTANRKSSSTNNNNSKNNNNQQRNSIKSQEDLLQYRYRVKSEVNSNPNAYHDKITDQKFFNRNFKIKPETSTTPAATSATSANTNNSMNTVDLIERNYTTLGQSSNYDTIMVGSNDYNNQYNGTRLMNSYHERERSSESKNNHTTNVYNTPNNINNNNTSFNTNLNVNSANSNPINKLKLLKKRNALKKTLSNANAIQTSTQHIQASSPSNRSQNFDNLINTSSKEDFRSQTSLNNTSNVISNLASGANRPLSLHLSRNSLNNIENSLTLGSNQQLMHKSSETIDEIILRDAKNKENSNSNSFNRVRSVSRLNMTNVTNNPEPVRTKSENELNRKQTNNSIMNSNKLRNKNELDYEPEIFDSDTANNTNANTYKFSTKVNKALAANSNYLNNRVKSSIPTNNRRENNSPVHQRSSTRLDNNNNTNSTSVNNSTALQRTLKSNGLVNRNTNLVVKNSINMNGNLANPKAKSQVKDKIVTYQNNYEENNDTYDRDEQIHTDFRIVYPGNQPEIIKINHNIINPGDTGYSDLLFEPNPYNIMSDPVISEQFRKLYEEDEYFQQVHRKCCEWLNKYVFPEMEKEKLIQNELSFPNKRQNF